MLCNLCSSEVVVMCVLVLCSVGMPAPQMSHRQSLPSLSRSSKLSLATVPRSIAQQHGTPGRRSSAQAAPGNSYKIQSQPKRQTQGMSNTIPSRPQVSPVTDLKSRATREQSPSSTSLASRTNGTSGQMSRLVAASRYY